MNDITEQELQSLRNLGNEYERAADEIERLRAKLEWMPDGPDGIDCRNETIKLQDESAERLRARVADLERQIDAATDVICDLGGELREPDMIESQRVREDLRARVAMLEDDANEGRAITAMPIQIGDDLCYLPVNAHGIVKRAMADAARYQWLRRWRSFHGSSYPTPPYVVRCALNPLPAEQACNGDELDAAIDTSLAAIETTERELHK